MKAVFQVLGFTVASGVTLFAPAGTFTWWNAWVFLGIGVLLIGLLTFSLFSRSPELLEERQSARAKSEAWDRPFVFLLGLLPLVLNIVAGFDHRFNWGPTIPVAAALIALFPMLLGIAFTFWAMKSNPFFSSYVRIQNDRGHKVVSKGPYAWVRHPGYTGSILFNLAVPVLLGSCAALVVGIVTLLVLTVRTAREDRTLMRQLPGYIDYAERVRFRLLPLVW